MRKKVVKIIEPFYWERRRYPNINYKEWEEGAMTHLET